LVRTLKLEIEIPEEVLSCFGSSEDAATKVKEAAVLELLRQKKISQGKAAQLLGMNRWEFYDLMAEHNIPMIDLSPEELKEGTANLRKAVRESR
jgi:predicted HTH domain antitoxin